MDEARKQLAMKVANAMFDELKVWWDTENMTREEINFAVGVFTAAVATPADRREIEAYYLAAQNHMRGVK